MGLFMFCSLISSIVHSVCNDVASHVLLLTRDVLCTYPHVHVDSKTNTHFFTSPR
jgi:hypothetical protein